MRTRSLSDLITDVRRRADIENVTDRYPNTELIDYINASIAQLYSELDRSEYGYYQSTQTITTSNSTGSYALNSDVWRIKGVTLKITDTVQIRARKHTPTQKPFLRSVGAWMVSLPIYYRVVGKDPFSSANKDAGLTENIEFSPIPSGSYTVYVDYVKTPQRLTSLSDEFDGIAGFDEFVVLDAAIKVKRKNRVDCQDLMLDRDRILEGWIKSAAADRDQAHPDCIQDVQTDTWWEWFGGLN